MMPYNNYNAYGGQSVVNPRVNNPAQLANWNTGWNGYTQVPQQSADGRIYVNGRSGADAYPIPNGMNFVVLWDTDSHRFFVKGYDNNGMPRVLEDNDYKSHIDPEPVSQTQVDMSMYATKDDIKSMIAEAFSNATIPSMVGYVTKDEMNKAFSELTLGNGGRIVRANESNG